MEIKNNDIPVKSQVMNEGLKSFLCESPSDENFLIKVFLFILYLVLLLKTAWISDDCMITCRTIYNFLHGYGLTWNTSERVQTYTHPLWLFLITPFYGLTHEFTYTIMLLSILVSGLAVYWLIFKVSNDSYSALVCITAILFSRPFVDFSTSGLENPLSHLLFVFFAYSVSRFCYDGKNLFCLTLFFALALVTRLDTILLYLPLLIYISVKSVKWVKGSFWIMLAGLSPIILWELFAAVYYGFLFPNTYYAKIYTGIPQADIYKQGILYFMDSLSKDYITLPCTALIVIYSLKNKKDACSYWLSVGIILYLMYLLSIGGDFMRGRFISLPFLASIFILSRIELPRKTALSIVMIIVLFGLYSDNPSISTKSTYFNIELNNGIADERGFYNIKRSLINTNRDTFFKKIPVSTEKIAEPKIDGPAGDSGYEAGPNRVVVDLWALGDPLLSKLHISEIEKKTWRIGHYLRDVPDGYVESIMSDKNCIVNTYLRNYYGKLHLITSGTIFSYERFLTILKMNLGMYDSYLHLYNRRNEFCEAINLSDVSVFLDGVLWTDLRCHAFYNKGIMIDLKIIHSNAALQVSLDNNDHYEMVFYNKEKEIGKINIGPNPSKFGVTSYDVSIPDEIRKTGFDKVKIVALQGDGHYSLGHLLFK